ncbi:penicillin acylase family protein [Roseococcus pinisoli]|uniref:Penicillin acylase family protein n=1 Tax=Roseococcus pinisoli TaxID=2835040 RepID=A0ABS5QDD6_9PROT|nr:penicillin acylase family protein [Roseococcus pinisoli]MBS7811403.1 penicillin acylase family protein [Roseococcus pinisoli]
MDQEELREAARRAVPDLTGEIVLDGLQAPVTVLRDSLGVPHIRAGSMRDAFFAQGFCHAQDRLFQMELNRRRALGRSAEWLGPSAFTADALSRRLGVEAASRRDAAALGDEAKTMIEAYAAGVNAFLASGAPVPIEYRLLDATPEPWEGWHTIAVMRRLGLLMGSVWFKLWRAAALPLVGEAVSSLRYDDGGKDLLILPQGAEAERWTAALSDLAPAVTALMEAAEADATGGGSNNWAVSAELSATGRPLLAGDPHRVLELPNMYAQGHLACPEFDAIGLTVPGVPGFPHFAHNGKVAWCVTHGFADIHDLYVERFDAGAQHAMFRGMWEPVARRVEHVAIRGEAPRAVEVVETRHGPVIAGDPASGHALALKSVQFAETDLSFDCLPRMLRAGSVKSLYQAARGWGLIDHNLVAGDTDGHIGWLLRASLPRRGRECGWLPMPGWTGEHEWKGWIPPEEMPVLHDPAGGIIVTANNRIADEDHPDYLLTDSHPPYRARRVAALLTGDPATRSPAGSATIHGDTLSQPAGEFVARLKALKGCSGAAEAFRQEIAGWDGRMAASSVTAARYIAFRLALTRRLATVSGLGALGRHPYLQPAPGVAPLAQLWWTLPALLRENDTRLLKGESWDGPIQAALDEVAEGPVPESWGEVHRPKLAHPLSALFPEAASVLDPVAEPLGGDGDCVLANGLIAPVGPRTAYAALSRYAFDVGDWENSLWTVFHGTSGHPGSRHYTDQHKTWAAARMTPMRYGWELLEAEAEARQVLRP